MTIAIPRSVLVYGILGLIPFFLPPLVSGVSPAHAGILGLVPVIYGALILSFLGGARWGQEAARPQPRLGVISLSMLPTLAGLTLLLATWLDRHAQLVAMAALFGLQFVWDAGSLGLPAWYTRLRLILTVGAVAALLAMAALVQTGAAAVVMT
ncbi:MAG: DUF3429 domain-containing protein [Sandarakinorhabdus sp.]|nr:DUF3429 domain-containing protein [Sandarakinorhabdus sp.]